MLKRFLLAAGTAGSILMIAAGPAAAAPVFPDGGAGYLRCPGHVQQPITFSGGESPLIHVTRTGQVLNPVGFWGVRHQIFRDRALTVLDEMMPDTVSAPPAPGELDCSFHVSTQSTDANGVFTEEYLGGNVVVRTRAV
jgi:hypothetical protein